MCYTIHTLYYFSSITFYNLYSDQIQIYTLFSDLTDFDAKNQSKKPLLTNEISNYSTEVNGFVW